MKVMIRLFLALAGFGVAGAMVYFLDPAAVDVIGFGIFYFSLFVGSFNLFLLFRLSLLQAGLLNFLLITFLLLQQFNLFTFWLGLILVVVVIIIEQYGARR